MSEGTYSLEISVTPDEQLRKTIEELAEWVHPAIGDYYQCATGEPYVVIGVAVQNDSPRNRDMLASSLIEGIKKYFGVGGRPEPAGVVAEGHPTPYLNPGEYANHIRFLYWRRHPAFKVFRPTDTDPEVVQLSCRLCFSATLKERGQLHKEVYEDEASAKDTAAATALLASAFSERMPDEY